MANRQRAEARRKAAAKAARQENGGKLWMWLTLGVIAVVAVVGGVVVLTGGDGETSGPADSSTSSSTAPAFPDSQPITIEGDALPSFNSPADDPAIGMTAPLLTGLDFRGDEIVVDPTVDGPVMLVFLAHWCPHCNAEMPRLLDWKNSGGVPPELNVIGVATAVASTAPNYPPHEWFSNRGWSWPILVDQKVDDNGSAGRAAQAYGASGWPYFVIIGADGTVKARSSGELEVSEIQAIVDAALA